MILLDTHAWVWYHTQPQKLSRKAAEAISSAKKNSFLSVAAISCWEVAMLVAKKRLAFNIDVQAWLDMALALPEMRLAELTSAIAVLSTRLVGFENFDPSDCLIAATALSLGCPLVTRDEKLRDFPLLKTIW